MSSSNNAAASSSSTLSYATYKKTRFVDVPISDKLSSFPISQNTLDVYHSSLLSRITPSVKEQFLGSPIHLASPPTETQHKSTTRRLRAKAMRQKARKEMICHIAYGHRQTQGVCQKIKNS